MRVVLGAIGRIGAGPEASLVEHYLERARKAGRGLGVTRVDVAERAESRHADTDRRKAEEAAILLAFAPAGALLVAFDEHGATPDSPAFAGLVDRARGVGRDIAFLLGGPDGHGPELLARADHVLAMGRMTFPHALARVMVAEQIYRSFTILARHPYHRV
jgi:23S rRNA (pseudouridine1915-N3)-methyltransferase